jgi:hypothetical protein
MLSLLADTCGEGSRGGSFLGLGFIISSVTNLGFRASMGCRTLGGSSTILGGAGGITGRLLGGMFSFDTGFGREL